MTVDGRNHSVGATLAEAALYMRQFGAFNAINLDGGGSTTMAATKPGGTLSVVNTPSGGSQRAVINTIGLVNTTTMGPVTSLNIIAPPILTAQPPGAPVPVPTPIPFGPITSININAPQNIPVGMVTPIHVFGYDDYLNRTPISLRDLFTTVTPNATMVDGGIIPNTVGTVIVQVSDGENWQHKEFNAVQVVEIIPSVREINESVSITFHGVDNLGQTVPLNPAFLNFEVYPQSLGRLENGRFTAAGEGFGWARAFTDTASAFIPVSIYRAPRQINPLNEGQVTFTASPGVQGAADFSTERSTVGAASLRIAYTFEEGERNQFANAAIANIADANAITYRIAVHGNNSGHALLGNILDANGNTFSIEFTNRINFTGWRDLTARVPQEAVHPVRLTDFRIISATEDGETEHVLFIDNLRAHERLDSEPAVTPSGTTARDPLRPQFMGERAASEYDMTFMGPMTFTGATAPTDFDFFRNLAISAISRDSAAAFYGGLSDISGGLDIPAVSRQAYYRSLVINDINLLQVSSLTGTSVVNTYQWSRLRNDLASTTMDNIIIHTNISPLNFSNALEFAIFHDMLLEQVLIGRNVFVVSNGGATTTVELRDGVRYINLAAMFVGNEINPEFSILRFRFGVDGVRYGLERIFN